MSSPDTQTEAPQAEAPASGTLIDLTPAAQAKAREFLAEEDDPSGKVLRVGVTSGGCSGFSYSVSIDVSKEKDHLQHYDGITLACDPVSLPFLKGARVDYVDEVGHAGFKFDNPQATSNCGCGTSFNV